VCVKTSSKKLIFRLYQLELLAHLAKSVYEIAQRVIRASSSFSLTTSGPKPLH